MTADRPDLPVRHSQDPAERRADRAPDLAIGAIRSRVRDLTGHRARPRPGSDAIAPNVKARVRSRARAGDR
jgi:hypothetical protein